MSSSLPDGFTVRAATRDDAAAIAALLRAVEIDVRGRSNVAEADARQWLRYVELETDSWLVEAGEALAAAGMLVALAEPPDLWAAVRPDLRGRGLGSALVQLAEDRARARGSEALRAGTYGDDVRAAALLTARGYREVRRYFTMAIELRERPPEPRLPQGLRIDTFRLDDAREFHAAQGEAFADEWGFAAMPFDEWKRLRLEAEDFDPELWFLARDGDAVAGVIRCVANHLGGGFVGAVAVRVPWRRRGLGEALLLHAFRAFYDRGERWVRLGVDTQNPTGATRLYERVGMHVELEDVVYERELV